MFEQNEPGEDILDLRQILERVQEIHDTAEADREPEDRTYLEQVAELEAQLYRPLAEAADNEPVLILDSYFTEFAQQEAEDLGLIDDSARWPSNCIDWEQAARELQQDYSAVTFGGFDYWTRS